MLTPVNIFRARCLRHFVSQARVCYNKRVREKEFIMKVHKHLPKAIYKWKINDKYQGGVPDAFYAGPNNHCFIEYKYSDSLPAKDTSLIPVGLTEQQRLWLLKAQKNKILCYWVFGSKLGVYMSQDFDKTTITKLEYDQNNISFKEYINELIEICLGQVH